MGDGLVSQIPSVITSIAAALLLSKGGAHGSADRAVLSQLGGYPGALGTVAALMGLFAFVPGLPFVPFILGSSILAIAAVLSGKSAKRAEDALFDEPPEEDLTPEIHPRRPIGDLLDVDEIHVRFAADLVGAMMAPGVGLEKRIVNMRRHIATEFGFVMPEVRLTDDAMLAPGHYAILIQSVEVADAILRPGRVLVLTRPDRPLDIPGEDVAEPVYGAAARWVDESLQDEIAAHGLPTIAPGEVVATHLLEMVQAHFGRLFTRRALRQLLDAFAEPSDPVRAEANRKLLDEYIPDRMPLDLLQTILRLLLEERVSIRNLPLILEAGAEARTAGLGPEEIVEHVRKRIAFHIVSHLADVEGRLPLIQLAPHWESAFEANRQGEGAAAEVVLPPEEFNRLAASVSAQLGKAAEKGLSPALAVPARRRRFLRSVLDAKGVRVPVLAFEEIGRHAEITLVGTA